MIAQAPANPGIIFSNNLWSKTPPVTVSGPGDIIADPLLSRAGATGSGQLTANWFTIAATSPARDKACSLVDVPRDYFGVARELLPDIGAVEFRGDVSGDGRVTMYDAALVLKYTVGGLLTSAQQAQADINSDTTVDAADAQAIAKRALGL